MATNKKKNLKGLIVIIAVAVIGLAGGVYAFITNARSERVPANPPETIGNTAGNINNGGRFCELNGKVYFSNSFDNDTLYCMNTNETDIKRISGAVISNILGAGDYIYYFQRSESGETGLGGVRVPFSFNRSRTDGKKASSVVRTVVTSGQLVGNRLFLQGMDDNGAYFFEVGTDGSGYKEIGRYVLNPACAYNGSIYYNSTVENHHLMIYNTETGFTRDLLGENVWNPVLYGDYVYYMDPGNGYSLRRFGLTTNTVEILCKDKIQHFNVGNGYIYYQTGGKSPGLYYMSTDGSGVTLMANGQFHDINMTTMYVYFRDFFDDTVTYHAYLGINDYSVFGAAMPPEE